MAAKGDSRPLKGESLLLLSSVNGSGAVQTLSDAVLIPEGSPVSFDLTGVISFDGLDDADNVIVDLNIGAGNSLQGLSWDVGLETLGGSWLSEATIQFSSSAGSADPNAIDLSVGVGDDFAGDEEYSSGGVLLFSSVPGLPDITVGSDGILRLQFFEGFDDTANAADANWRNAAVAAVVDGLGLVCSDQAGCNAAVLGTPVLALGAVTSADVCVSTPANNNGVIEPGELVNFTIPVAAVRGDFTNVMGMLSSATAGVTVVSGMGSYGSVASGTSVDASYSVLVDTAFTCDTAFDLNLAVTSAEGNRTFAISRDVGGDAITYNGLPATVPDNVPAGRDVTAVVSNVTGNLTNVQVAVDMTHTWVGDLIISLTSPAGTTVTLLDRPNVPLGTFGCSNNNVNVTFADGQPDPEAICSGAPPQGDTAASWPVTDAGPVDPLSAFNGEDANGTWTLTVSDNGPGDTGAINSWELIITPAGAPVCNVCLSPEFSFNVGTLNFGSIATGSASSPGFVTLSNTGGGAGQIDSLAITGPFSLSGGTCPATPFTLGPGESCTVGVVFTAGNINSFQGTLTATGAGQSLVVGLTGQSIIPPPAFIPVNSPWALGILLALMGVLGTGGLMLRRNGQ